MHPLKRILLVVLLIVVLWTEFLDARGRGRGKREIALMFSYLIYLKRNSIVRLHRQIPGPRLYLQQHLQQVQLLGDQDHKQQGRRANPPRRPHILRTSLCFDFDCASVVMHQEMPRSGLCQDDKPSSLCWLLCACPASESSARTNSWQ